MLMMAAVGVVAQEASGLNQKQVKAVGNAIRDWATPSDIHHIAIRDLLVCLYIPAFAAGLVCAHS